MTDQAGVSSRLSELFELRESGPDKTTSTDDAIRKFVRPGMTLYATRYAGALISALIRAHTGSSPGFTLITLVLRDHALNLLASNLLKKVIIAQSAYSYPSPGPIHLVQEALAARQIDMEEWSVYSLNQRLQAGALGHPFALTRSIVGSDLAHRNRDSFAEVDDPFGSGKIGVVKSLTADLALVHGCVADSYGNTILPSSHEDPIPGAWAAREGVVVSVEKIVSTDVIRRHSSQVRIPGSLVRAVCKAPFGGHPNGIVNFQLTDFEGYGADYDFLQSHREATKDKGKLAEWVREWALLCPTPQDYMHKLGSVKLSYLRGRGRRDAWEESLATAAGSPRLDAPPNIIETMVVNAARRVAQIIEHNNYNFILAGAGIAALASALAYYNLRSKGADLNLLLGSGLVGYAPRPGDPMFTSVLNVPTAQMIANSQDVYGSLVAGPYAKTLSVLGSAQLDKFGNLNTSRLTDPAASFLTGAGGANDAVNSCETLVVMQQSRGRFLERVDHISCNGERVKTVVSQMGIFEKQDGELVLTSLIPPQEAMSIDQQVQRIKEHCGWEVKVSPKLVASQPPPTSDELILLRAMDPMGIFLNKLDRGR